MNTPLQSTNLTADDMTATMLAGAEELEGEEEHVHIHMPNGSLWPIILALAVCTTRMGLTRPLRLTRRHSKNVETANHLRGGRRYRATNCPGGDIAARCAGCS